MVARGSLLARAVAALLAATLIAGCGEDEPSQAKRATVALDFTPNAVHAPIYAAIRGGHDRERGVRLRIQPPGSAPDSIKLLAAGKVDLAVLDIHDLGLARERGQPFVGVAALVQRPLAAIIAQRDVRRPRDLEGRRVGVSGLPSDPAVLRAVLEDDGGDIRRVKQVTIGFAAVANLVQGKVAAVPAFWNAEGVVLKQRGARTREFRVDDYGAPRYPEVVLLTTRRKLREEPDLIERSVMAIGDGVRDVLRNPEAAVRDIARAGSADPKLVRAQLRAVSPAFSPPLVLLKHRLEAWAAWDARFGILKRKPDIEAAFQFNLAR